ncbi:MAG: hypothetical protein R6W78_17535 [Bacteroidales bacterium]
MKNLFLFVFIILFFSCEKKEDKPVGNDLTAYVINKSSKTIDSVVFYTLLSNQILCDSVLITDIEVSKEKSINWHDVQMCNANGKYLIKAYLNDTIFTDTSGTFTNGETLIYKISAVVLDNSMYSVLAKHIE